MWFIGIVILVVLMIPLTAIVLDSEVGRALARRLGSEGQPEGNGGRIRELEDEVQYLSEAVKSLQEETQFIRQLLEKPGSQESLPSGED